MNKKKWVVYLVRCSDKSLYCGISNDYKGRLIEHNSGKGAKYTRSRRPVELVGISPEMTKSEALKLEYCIKQIPADKKIEALTRKENEMTISKKKTAQPMATDQVLRIINRSKKGVDTATLMKKTGFDKKKISNILQRTYKQGKIQRVAKGIYVSS